MADALLVVAPNWLGDAVMALPAIDDLRRARPGSRVVVAARRAVAALFHLVPWVDEVVTLEWRGRLFERRALAADRARLQSLAPGVAVVLPNSFASAWLVRQTPASERWGYATDWRGRLLTRAVPLPGRSLHQGAYYQHLVHALGFENGPLAPVVAPPAAAIEQAHTQLRAGGWDGAAPVVVMAPGAAYGTAKRWPPEHFARLCERIVADASSVCVLVGSGADANTTRVVRESVAPSVRPRVIDLAGRTDLPTLAAVLGVARACVANDSGAMHLAAACGVPTVALFGPTREYESAPLARPSTPVEVLINPVWCRPCMLRECPLDHRCMRGLTVDRVAASVAQVCGNAGGRG